MTNPAGISGAENAIFYYLGANPLHTGLYASVIALMEEAGLQFNLIVNQPLEFRRPLELAKVRRHITRSFIGPSRQAIKGSVFGPVPFHYRAKPLYALAILPILLGSLVKGKRLVLHARTLHVADAALLLRRLVPRIQIVAELEGDGESELLYAQERGVGYSDDQLSRRLAIDRLATRRVLSGCDAVICVTHGLRALLAERHDLSPEIMERILVIPTLATGASFFFDQEKRSKTRRAWGIEGRYVVAYSGNLATPWQLPEETVRLFGIIKRARDDAFLLIVSPETDHEFIVGHIERAGLSRHDYQLRPVPYQEMPACLCAADLGVILRENHPMNEVSSPGKIAEYLLTGLPVIAAESVGDYAERLRGVDEALVISNVHERDSVERVVQEFVARDVSSEERLAFSNWSAERFSLEAVSPTLEAVYRQLLAEHS